MEKYIIEGGQRLKGTVENSGAKNSALPILISTLLIDEPSTIENIPNLNDINTTIELLEYFGKEVVFDNNIVKITQKNIPNNLTAPYELVKKMRASFLVAGPLLSRYKKANVSLPGGCLIGARPVDIHLDGFKSLGADVRIESGYVKLKTKKLKGNKISLRYPSVGATENLIMASVLMDNEKTVISNIAIEPEVIDLINFLKNAGAKIKFLNKRTIEIEGVKKLNGTAYKIIPDRIEAGTFLIAAAMSRGEVEVKNCIPEHLNLTLKKLKSTNAEIQVSENSIKISHDGKIKPTNITTKSYPGFPTDLQAQWIAFMSIANGKSVIEETIFESRFLHVAELLRMGANLKIEGNKVIVNGTEKLTGAEVMASDLRAGAALVLAGLVAEGVTKVSHIYHLKRGYEDLHGKFLKLGAKIKVIDE